MKKIIQYMSAFLILAFMGTSCQDNENWVILTDVQPGYYVAGEATIYSSVAPAASFVAAPLSPRDGESADQFPGMYSKFTYLKAGSEFTVIKATADGNPVTYGKGSVVSGETTALIADGPAYTVSADGMYFLVLNTIDNQLTILSTPWEAIGAATPGGWSTGTPLTPAFDEAALKMNFSTDLVMSADEMKFRFVDWEILVPYGSADVRIFSNMGAAADGAKLSGSPTELKDGGGNLGISTLANYKITLSFDLKTSKFTASVVQGEIIEPTYPETMYMIGSQFGGWNWGDDGIVELVPVNGNEGKFWCVRYFNEESVTAGFKWCPVKDWNGDFMKLDNNIGFTLGDNAQVATAGMYLVYIDLTTSTITMEPAKVYGMGDCFGGWTAGDYPFTVAGDKMNITTTGTGELRLYVSLPGTEWWQTEFVILNGKIEYRGKGGDQVRVSVDAGKVVTLDFNAGTGTIQ